MRRTRLNLFMASILIGVASCASQQPAPQITVFAGEHDRQQTVVSFTLPQDAPANPHLRDEQGRLIPLQVRNGEASFVLERLQAGSAVLYSLVSGRDETPPAVRVEREDARLKVTVAGRTLFHYQAEPGELPRPDINPILRRGGYIHPVRTPGGVVVTDDFPVKHAHHHGIWFAWTNTRFEGRNPDFWNMGQGRGTIEFVTLHDTWDGTAHGGFRAEHRHIDLMAPEPKTALTETWEVAAYGLMPELGYWFFDLASFQQCATDSPLVLPRYHYGGLGVRGHEQWDGRAVPDFLTSEGIDDRVKGNETEGRWVQMSGEVDGEHAAIAILCHPENFRFPQPMRLHPSEPFFCYAPSQQGEWSIQPGETYLSRYRFVLHDGTLEAGDIDRLWNDYAHPPEVSVTPGR